MKKSLIIFIILVLFLPLIIYRNNNPKIIISNLKNREDIKISELKYRVYLLGILPVGDAIFKIEGIKEYQGQKVYHLNAVAAPLKLYSRFYKGYAILDSYVDPMTYNPLFFRQKITIPNKEPINREVFYDQNKGVMTLAGVRRQIFPNTQDPLSILLNIIRLDFDNIKELEINLNTNQKNYLLEAEAESKDISINKKIYKIVFLKAEIRRRDKNPYHQSKISMVLLREKENVPLLIRVFASGILINARLIEVK